MSTPGSVHEDFKEEPSYEGYKDYRQKIDPDKLVVMNYNFDHMKLAVDTLFRKWFENQQQIDT